MQRIEIKAPQFDQYEFVTLHWNGQSYPAKVVRRWFDADDESWWYLLTGSFASERLDPEAVLSYQEVRLDGTY